MEIARLSRGGAEGAEKAIIFPFFSVNSPPLREKIHWESVIENFSSVIVLASRRRCCFALRFAAGGRERGVKILESAAARQARRQLRPGDRRRAMDPPTLKLRWAGIFVLTRRS